jgi:hypothetical protein
MTGHHVDLPCDYSGIPALRRASSHRVSTSGCLCGKRYLTFLIRKSGSLERTNSVAVLAAFPWLFSGRWGKDDDPLGLPLSMLFGPEWPADDVSS